VALPSDEPFAVVALPEREQSLAEMLDRGEVLDPEEQFFRSCSLRALVSGK